MAHERGDVTVNHAAASDHAFQLIGNNTIGTINYGVTTDEKAQRQFQAVLQWLSPSDEAIKLQNFIHDQSRSNHKLEETGLWFIHSKPFNSWLEGTSRLTWVNGGMGCGKTVLFFLAVEKVRKMCREDRSKNFGYFYCTSRAPLGQSIAVLFRSLLRQLCHSSIVPAAIQGLYDVCDEGLDHRSPTVHELARTLMQIVGPSNPAIISATDPQHYYFLIDGLDELESSSREELLQELQPLLLQNLPHVHILITSRAQREIEETLQEGVVWDLFPVDTESVQGDIRTFVISEIQSHRGLRRLPQQTQDTILSRVVDQSNGMFRWAFLQVQSLKKLRLPVTPEKVHDMLQTLPKDLDETYERMLNGLDEFDKPTARRALIWLVFSARQLYVEELVDACAFDVEKKPLVDNKLAPTDIELLLQDLILIRPPIPLNEEIVEFQKHTVMLVHASIREFLVKERVHSEEQASLYFALTDGESHFMLARSCLAYLLCFNTYEMRDCHEEFPLRQYAWYHWEEHIDTTAEHCVPTIPTAMIRRKARRLFSLIKRYLDQLADYANHEMTAEALLENLEGEDLDVFRVILKGLHHTATSYELDLQLLKIALNVPFFHPRFDEFCPTKTASAPSCEEQSKHSSSGPDMDFKLSGRVASYKYRPLSRSPIYIRLLEILPAVDPDTLIQCRLFDAVLDDAPPYAALSYVWGDPRDKAVISIEGHTFHVSRSQLIVLRSMRSRSEDVSPAIWLDALCMNQMDDEERSTQVMIMGTIFARAREVVVGLSNDDGFAVDKGVHLLADLASSTSFLTCSAPTEKAVKSAKHTIMEIDRSGGWGLILGIFQNPWWRRMWVIQEIVLGIRAVIIWASMSFNFNLVEQVMIAEDFIKRVLREGKSPNLATIEKSAGWDAARQIVRTRLEYRQNREFPLPVLLWRFRNSLATDPRDKIFAILGLCNRQELSRVFVDYRLGPDEVACRASLWILETYKNLDLLSIRSACSLGLSSSWGPRYSWCFPLVQQLLDRQPLSPGIFKGRHSFNIYSAAGAETQPIFVPENQSFRGMTFDEIADVIGPSQLDISSMDGLVKLCKKISLAQSSLIITDPKQRTIEAKWRTLFANQWPFGTKLGTSTFQGAKVPPETEDDEKKLLDVISIQSQIPQLKGRQVIITSGGRLGLALEEVQQGDSIVILPGGALPFVLRVHGNDWMFLGECYVHDYMDGQIVNSASPPGKEWWTETFSII